MEGVDRVLAELGDGTPERPVALGRYDIVGRLGRGGMGTVYDAIDRERGTKVALKTLSAADASAGVGLKREFRVVADLTHENLAQVYELASDRGVWFFTMERVEGVSLSSWARDEPVEASLSNALPISRTLASPGEVLRTLRSPGVDSASPREPAPPKRPLHIEVPDESKPRVKPAKAAQDDAPTRRVADAKTPEELPSAIASPNAPTAPKRSPEELRRSLAELVSGVTALHEAGLRHGDIKPANVIVREDGRVVLVDFGLVRPVDEQREMRTSSGGTPTFMAPEQFGEGRIGAAADWYAVGATLYQVLTGLLPFEAASLLDLYLKKVSHAPAAPHELVPSVPRDLSELALALMNPEPQKRPVRGDLLAVSGQAPHSTRVSIERPRRSVFVGRDVELCALERAYGTARAGTATVVHTHGPSGIGKSALLTSFLGAVQEVDAALVLRGRCYERETVPYKGFDRIIDELSMHLERMSDADVEKILPDWAGELGRAFPALGAVCAIAARAAGKHVAHDPIELRRRARVAFAELLGALRKRGPVVVTIDDLQWADEDSAQLLEALIDARAPYLIVLLFRQVEAAAAPALTGYFERAKRLEAAGQLVDLPLSGLEAREAEDLARAALGGGGLGPESERRAKFLAREAHGVPFFIEELAHYIRQRGLNDSHEEVSLEAALRARFESLTADQRTLLEIVAVAGAPVPQAVVFEAAGLDQGALGALLALRNASLLTVIGAGASDLVSAYHDRIRESVSASLSARARLEKHVALGRAFAKSAPTTDRSRGALFEAVRHLGAGESLITEPSERLEVARLHAEAGERARAAAAFPLALDCFEGGIAILPADAWQKHYALTLRLYAGATEAAYLRAEWGKLDAHIAQMKEHARTVMDEIVAWEAQIDAYVGRHQYLDAVERGLEALRLLGVHIPAEPTLDDVGAAVKQTLGRLTDAGPQGLITKADLADPVVIAANRIQVRVSPAAYFGKPILLPLIACNLLNVSIERGVSAATPYALALFGIVLNTIELYPIAHEWGQLALRLLDRWPDRRLEAATRHILYNLVCCWKVPLSTILEPLRGVFDLGCRTGDYEYASYAAHGYVHNAMYAGRSLAPLLDESLSLHEAMRSLGQVNALHVHTPFEQLLKGLTGKLANPACLDDEGFSEAAELERAQREGSRSGVFILGCVTGLARWYFGSARDAHACFERAHAHIDAAASVWHLPILFQFGALAACAVARTTTDETEKQAAMARARSNLDRLVKLAEVSEANFEHRVALVEGARMLAEANLVEARIAFDRAIELAHAGAWLNDVALANELAIECAETPAVAARRARAARMAYVAWGANAKAERLPTKLEG